MEKHQLPPGLQWFIARRTGKIWWLAIEATSAFHARERCIDYFRNQGVLVNRDEVEAEWLPGGLLPIQALPESP
jgi:hypothetical protein